MEDIDAQHINMLVAPGDADNNNPILCVESASPLGVDAATSFQDPASVIAHVRRTISDPTAIANGSQDTASSSHTLSSRGGAAAGKKNFLIDTSTPHGDVIISESSVLKPSLGWITTYATESLRRGVHEWAVKVEHQGETSDGSGLMLGIVPKSFSKFDSFISQGGGWCLSRAGKLYGHWRRVDNNTSVGSLTFATGDRVIFLLDFDTARLTVRVGDRSITGEISGLTSGTEILPAVSLHYRHQHVRFEYHRVHNRNVPVRNWVQRGCFPSAVLYLPATSTAQLRKLPLDVYVLSSEMTPRRDDSCDVSETAADPATPLSETSVMLRHTAQAATASQARLSIVLRALVAIQRFRTVGAASVVQFLPPDVTAEFLREQAGHFSRSSAAAASHHTGGGGARSSNAFGLNAAALLLSHIAMDALAPHGTASPAPSNYAALLLGAAPSLAQYLMQQPLFSLAECGGFTELRPHVLATVSRRLRDVIASLRAAPVGATPPMMLSSLVELQLTLAIQTGAVSNMLGACLTSFDAATVEGTEAIPATWTLSSKFVEWVSAVENTVTPRYRLDLDKLVSHQRSTLRRLSFSNTPSQPLSAARLEEVSAPLSVPAASSAAVVAPNTASPGKPSSSAAVRILSMACDVVGSCVFLHTAAGSLERWPVSSALKQQQGDRQKRVQAHEPACFIGLCSSSSMAFSSSSSSPADHRLILHTNSMLLLNHDPIQGGGRVAAIVFNASTLTVDRVVPLEAVLTHLGINGASLGDGGRLILSSAGGLPSLLVLRTTSSCATTATADSARGAARAAASSSLSAPASLLVFSSFPNELARPPVNLKGALSHSQPPTSPQHPVHEPSERCLLLVKDTTIHLGDPYQQLHFPNGGQCTIELWIRHLGRLDELANSAKSIYAHGDRATTGEVFLEFTQQEGAFCVKGGYRHDNRGTSAVVALVPPGSLQRFLHVALTFKVTGGWQLILNGQLMPNVIKPPPPAAATTLSLERPRVKWTLGGGCVAHVADLRIWNRHRSVHEVCRDLGRRLLGDDAGLVAYYPLDEPFGCTVYNHAVGLLLGPANTCGAELHRHVRPPSVHSEFMREAVLDHPLDSAIRSGGGPQQHQKQFFNWEAALASVDPSNGTTLDVSSLDVLFTGSELVLVIGKRFNGEIGSTATHRLAIAFDARTGHDLRTDALVASALLTPGLYACCCPSPHEDSYGAIRHANDHHQVHLLALSNLAGADGASLLEVALPQRHFLRPSSAEATDDFPTATSLFEAQPACVHYDVPRSTVGMWLLNLLRLSLPALMHHTEGVGAVHRTTSNTPTASNAATTPSPLVHSAYSTQSRGPSGAMLFVPLQTDVSKEAIEAATAVLRLFFRPVNVASGRRVSNVKEGPHSAQVVDVVLRILQCQIEAILNVKLDPRPLGLAIGGGAATTMGSPVGEGGDVPRSPLPPRTNSADATTPIMSKIGSSMRMRTAQEDGKTAVNGDSLVSPSSIDDDGGVSGHLHSRLETSLGAQLVSTLCDLVNAAGLGSLLPSSITTATSLLRRGVVLFFPSDQTRVQLLSEMLSGTANAGGAANPQRHKPSIQALLGGVLNHFATPSAVASIPLAAAPHFPLENSTPLASSWALNGAPATTLPNIVASLLTDASRRCQLLMEQCVSQHNDSIPADRSPIAAMHAATLGTLSMTQLFLLCSLDTSDHDQSKAQQPQIAAARSVVMLGTGARTSLSGTPVPNAALLSVSGTPPPRSAAASPQTWWGLSPQTYTAPVDVANAVNDFHVKGHYRTLLNESMRLLSHTAQILRANLSTSMHTSPTATRTRQEEEEAVTNNNNSGNLRSELIGLLRTSVTGNVLFTAIAAIPLVISLDTAPWLQETLSALHAEVAQLVGVLNEYDERHYQPSAPPRDVVHHLSDLIHQQQTWIAAYMVTSGGASAQHGGNDSSATVQDEESAPPNALGHEPKRISASDKPSASASHLRIIPSIVSHPLCANGLTSLIDQTARGQRCAECISSPQRWQSMTHPPHPLDRAGSKSVQSAWAHLVGACAHLSSEWIDERSNDGHNLKVFANIGVRCRPLKQKLMEWQGGGQLDASVVAARLNWVIDFCALLLHVRSHHSRALSTCAALAWARSRREESSQHPTIPSRKPQFSAKHRWRELNSLVRRALMVQRYAGMTAPMLSVTAAIRLLDETCFPSQSPPADGITQTSSGDALPEVLTIRRAFTASNHRAKVKISGLHHLTETCSVERASHEATALDALRVFSTMTTVPDTPSGGALANRPLPGHYECDVSGCDASLREELQFHVHAFIGIGLSIARKCPAAAAHHRGMSTEQGTHPSTQANSPSLVSATAAGSVARILQSYRWCGDDFVHFCASNAVPLLVQCCSMFPGWTSTLSSGVLGGFDTTPRLEAPVERAHRLAVKDRHKNRGNSNTPLGGGSAGALPSATNPDDAPKPLVMTPAEESSALCWLAIKELTLQAADLLLTSVETNPAAAAAAAPTPTGASISRAHMIAAERLLAQLVNSVATELHRCLIYMSHFYYPAQERVCDHVSALCGVLGTLSRALAHSEIIHKSSCPPLQTALAKASAALVLVAHVSSFGTSATPNVSEHAMRACALVASLVRFPPFVDDALATLLDHTLTAASTSEALLSIKQAISAFHDSSSRCGGTLPHLLTLIAVAARGNVDSTAPSSASTPMHALVGASRLTSAALSALRALSVRSTWAKVLQGSLIPRTLKELSIALGVRPSSRVTSDTSLSSEHEARDSALRVLMVTHGLCDDDGGVPQVGALVRYCADSELRLTEVGVIVDFPPAASPAAGTAAGASQPAPASGTTVAVLPLSSMDYTAAEVEVSVESLRFSFGDHPVCFRDEDGAGQSPSDPSPFTTGKLPSVSLLLSLIVPALDATLSNASTSVSHTPIFAAIAAWLRMLSTICRHDPLSCHTLAHQNVLNRVYHTFGKSPATVPMPLLHLRELVPMAIAQLLRATSTQPMGTSPATTGGGPHVRFTTAVLGGPGSRYDVGLASDGGLLDPTSQRQQVRSTAQAMVAAAVGGQFPHLRGGSTSSELISVGSTPNGQQAKCSSYTSLFESRTAIHKAHNPHSASTTAAGSAAGMIGLDTPSVVMLLDNASGLAVPLLVEPQKDTNGDAGPTTHPVHAHHPYMAAAGIGESSGLTFEISLYVHDSMAHALLGESFPIPAQWSKQRVFVRHRLLSLVDAAARPLVSIDYDDDKLYVKLVSYQSAEPVTTLLPLMSLPSSECTDRWTRLTFTLHHNHEILAHRDGELLAMQTFDSTPWGVSDDPTTTEVPTLTSLIRSITVGQYTTTTGGGSSSSSSDEHRTAAISVRSIRMWNSALPKHVVRNSYDAAVALGLDGAGYLTPLLSFACCEGSGDRVTSDDGQWAMTLVGDGAVWAPQLPLPCSTSTTLTLELDVEQSRAAQQPHAADGVNGIPGGDATAAHNVNLALPSTQERREHWASIPLHKDVDDILLDFSVPRKEFQCHIASLEPAHLQIVVQALLGSLIAHDARRCLLHAIDTLLSARNDLFVATTDNSQLRNGTTHQASHQTVQDVTYAALNEIVQSERIPAMAANLVRYNNGPCIPHRHVLCVVRFMHVMLKRALLQVEHHPELQRDLKRSFLVEAVDLLRSPPSSSSPLLSASGGTVNQFEVFDIEIFYTALGTNADCQLVPLSFMNGGSGWVSFEVPRGMEYLFLFSDRQQKTSLAKFPDAQGSWPDVELSLAVSGLPSVVSSASSSVWCFAKPSASMKTSPARFRLRVPSFRPTIGQLCLQLLCEVDSEHPQHTPVLFDMKVLALFASLIRDSRGDQRLACLTTMTRIITRMHSCAEEYPVHDRCPLHLLLDRFNTFLFQTEKRNATHPASVFMMPGAAVFPPVVRRIAELLVAAMHLDGRWRGTSAHESFRSSWGRLIQRQHEAAVSITSTSDPPTAPLEVVVARVPSASPSTATQSAPSWRKRIRGVWYASCDRGWQTVRSSIGFSRGRWYLEVRLPSNSSPVSVGLVSNAFKGVVEVSSSSLGHCQHSWGFDGARLCRWHNGTRNEFSSNRTKWKGRDVVGLLIDLECGTLTCTHNGKPVSAAYDNIRCGKEEPDGGGDPSVRFYPAVSFTTSGCDINFGGAPFVYDLPQGYLPVDVSLFTHPRAGMSLAASLAVVELAQWASSDPRSPGKRRLPGVLGQAQVIGNCTGTLTQRHRQGSSAVNFVQVADRKQRCFDCEMRTGESGCLVRGTAVVSLPLQKVASVGELGRWYFEVGIHGEGHVQLGWAALPFNQRSIGDDALSWGINGCQMHARHNRQQRSLGRHPWRDGDIIGCFLDLTPGTTSNDVVACIGFTINGQPLRDLHDSTSNGTLFLLKSDCGGGAAVLALVPVIQLEPNSVVTVFTDASDLNFLPPTFSPLGNGDVAHRALLEWIRPQRSSGVEDDGQNCRSLQPAHLQLFSQAVSRLHDLSSFGHTVWSTRDVVALHLSAMKDTMSTEMKSAVDTPDLEVLLHWSLVLEGLLQDVGRLASSWDPTLPSTSGNDHRQHPSGSLGASVKYLLGTVASPVVALEALHMYLCSTNRPMNEHIKLTLNRRRALTLDQQACGASHVDRLKHSVFGQVFSLVGRKPSALFKTGKKLWSVSFAGEGADDVGGPYREALSEMSADVMNPRTMMFLPSSNQVNHQGTIQDRFTINPRPPPPLSPAMYTFLGRLLGGCLRSGEVLPLALPPTFWMRLACGGPQQPHTDALKHVDDQLSQSLALLVGGHACDDTLDELDTTAVVDATGHLQSIIYIPESQRVIPSSAEFRAAAADAYRSIVSAFRVSVEGTDAWDAVAQGFYQVVPAFALRSLKWYELEQTVCGQSDIDVEQLMNSARLDGLHPTDKRIGFLKDVLVGFTKHERALFLRFVTGRERQSFGLRLKLMPSPSMGSPDEFDDDHLPHASTCFYWLSIPNYSSQDVMRAKLLFAIKQCHDIDADFRVHADQDDDGDDAQPTVAVREEDGDDEFEDYHHLL